MSRSSSAGRSSSAFPPGLPLERFAEVAFRSAGAPTWEARALAQRFAANPAWLLDIPDEEVVNVQEAPLRTGHALLIEHLDRQARVEKATVIHSSGERTYVVRAKERQLGLGIASALPYSGGKVRMSYLGKVEMSS